MDSQDKKKRTQTKEYYKPTIWESATRVGSEHQIIDKNYYYRPTLWDSATKYNIEEKIKGKIKISHLIIINLK